ncbi:hypothetical protein P3S67_027551 [Capsicum chacoense]
MSLILPNYDFSSRIIVARQCLKIYQEEKQKLKRLIKGKRVCITSDMYHKGETSASAIESCLLDWGIENLFTVVLGNAWANDVVITHLKEKIGDWKGVIMGNNYLHVRCNAHILNSIVKEGLSEQNELISRVKNVVKYVKSSSAELLLSSHMLRRLNLTLMDF